MGLTVPVISFRSVLLPAPFCPMMASASPAWREKEMSFTGQNSSAGAKGAPNMSKLELHCPPARITMRSGSTSRIAAVARL